MSQPCLSPFISSLTLSLTSCLALLRQERKRALEAERQARVEELLTKRKEQEARIEQQRQEKEKAREDAARERARYHACRLGVDPDARSAGVNVHRSRKVKPFAVMQVFVRNSPNTEMLSIILIYRHYDIILK